MKKFYAAFAFFALLLVVNLYMFKPGFWFFQDAGFWPINQREAFIYFLQQLRTFNNYGYYLGFDTGLFSFSRILVSGFVSLSLYIFGFAGSQTVFFLAGYILTFI